MPEQVIRYSETNPPESYEHAQRRLEELKLAEEQLKIKLEAMRPEDFLEHFRFVSTKNGTTKALAHTRREMAYVNLYIKRNKPPPPPAPKKVIAPKPPDPPKPPKPPKEPMYSYEPASPEVLELIARVGKELLEGVQGKYQKRYTPTNPPTNLADARQRQAELSGIKAHLTACLAQIDSHHWMGQVALHKHVKQIKDPLVGILLEIDAELSALKAHVRSVSESEDKGSKRFLVSLVNRAITEGLALTDDELLRFEQIAQHYRQRDD